MFNFTVPPVLNSGGALHTRLGSSASARHWSAATASFAGALSPSASRLGGYLLNAPNDTKLEPVLRLAQQRDLGVTLKSVKITRYKRYALNPRQARPS